MYDILLIEDDAAIYFILGKYKLWKDSKFRITKRAANGKEALEILKGQAFDYIEKPFSEDKLAEALERAEKVIGEKDSKEQKSKSAQLLKYIAEDRQDAFVRQVLDVMAEHITDDYMLEQLAGQMNLTKDYIGKLFRAKTGHTLGECYAYMKMEYAKEMLKTTNMKIYEISELLGYSTVDYFSKIFKKHAGQTPVQYRKTERNNTKPSRRK